MGGNFSAAWEINNQGLVVGYSTESTNDPIWRTKAVVWPSGTSHPIALPTLGGQSADYPDGYGYAIAVNDSNVVVGESLRPDGHIVATLWKRNASRGGPIASGDTWEAIDLNSIVNDEVWLLQKAVDINNAGLIVGQGLKWIPNDQNPAGGTWEPRAFMLIPGALLTDVNRDGRIDTRQDPENEDRGRISRLNPWRFWINDDDDSGDTGTADIPGTKFIQTPPFGGYSGTITGVRDLVDYYPIHLDISELLSLFPPAEFDYVLEHQDGAVRYALTDLVPSQAGGYLTNVVTASSLAYNPVKSMQHASSSQIERLPEDFLLTIANDGKGVILVEGRKQTQTPIRLELRRNGVVAFRLIFPISLWGVEDMYRHRNLLSSAGKSGGPSDRLGQTNQQGEILGALYGKTDGDVEFIGGVKGEGTHIRFKYYLNPAPNDRNLEFDGKTNLFDLRVVP